MAHTPGPWTVGGQSDSTGEAEEICAASRVIAWTADTYDEDDDDGHITAEDRSNARLIAAAPDMLDALRAVKDELIELYERAYPDDESDNDTTRAIDAAIAAIAKAEGRTDDQ